MKPTIERTTFGAITIAGQVFKHDVVIRSDGTVEKRRKASGTSHTISLDEARAVYRQGAERLIVGTGQFGRVVLSADAAAYFREMGCAVDLLPTRRAAQAWNEAEGAVIGLFHLTC